MDSLASRLRKAREARSLSQPALAKLAGVSQGTIGNIEAGIRGGATSLAQIAHVLQIRYHWLRDGDGPMDLPVSTWPFSAELWDVVQQMEPHELRKAENQLRAHLDMDLLQKPDAESGKLDGTHG